MDAQSYQDRKAENARRLKEAVVKKQERDRLRAAGPLAHSVEEAAALLGISRRKIFDMIREGELRSFAIGKRRLISADALKACIRALEKAA